MTTATCATCGTPIAPVDHPSFCPKCGSGDRLIEARDEVVVELRERIELKKKRPGEKKPFEEVRLGDDLHRATNQWNRIKRVIDRDNDRYQEHITDGEGHIIRDVDEPLSEHRGRGSAKGAKPTSQEAES